MNVPDADDHMEVADEIYFCTLPDHVLRAMRLFGHEEREARRIVISGGGNIGLFLAREIEETQPSVMLKMIESNKARADFIAGQPKNDVVLTGEALDPAILKETQAGPAEA